MFRTLFPHKLSRLLRNKTKSVISRENTITTVISNRAVKLRTHIRPFYTNTKMYTPCSADSEDFDSMVEKLKAKIVPFPDFPKKGIMFWDIFTAVRDGPTCTLLHKLLIRQMGSHFPEAQAVVGLDARGFLFGFAVAQELSIGFIPIRKKGKLAGETVSYSYQLEYGSDTFQIQKGAVTPGLKCVIVDDLMATGGSCGAAINLLQSCGAKVLGCMVVIELLSLQARKSLPSDFKLHSLIQYD